MTKTLLLVVLLAAIAVVLLQNRQQPQSLTGRPLAPVPPRSNAGSSDQGFWDDFSDWTGERAEDACNAKTGGACTWCCDQVGDVVDWTSDKVKDGFVAGGKAVASTATKIWNSIF